MRAKATCFLHLLTSWLYSYHVSYIQNPDSDIIILFKKIIMSSIYKVKH